MKAFVTLVLSSLLAACHSLDDLSSTDEVEFHSAFQTQPEFIISGDDSSRVFINEFYIWGILDSKYDYPEADSVEAVLNLFNLERTVSQIPRLPSHIPPTSLYFASFKKINGEPFSRTNSPELAQLRASFGRQFGLGIYHNSFQVEGVLSNHITVTFHPHTEVETMEEIIRSSSPQEFIQVRENRYTVRYPESWGYHVIDVAHQLFTNPEVQYVENEVEVINSPTE